MRRALHDGQKPRHLFATESYEVLVTTLVTLHSQESMFEPSAAQVRLELIAV
jgi:hypothetical protein